MSPRAAVIAAVMLLPALFALPVAVRAQGFGPSEFAPSENVPAETTPSDIAPDDADIGADAVGPFPWLALDDLAATRDRPLFVPGRRPPAEPESEPTVVIVEEPEEDEAPAEPPRVRLAGVVLGGTAPVALIEDYDTETLLPFRAGAAIEEWTLDRIEPRAVVLRHGDQELRLEISAEFAEDE